LRFLRQEVWSRCSDWGRRNQDCWNHIPEDHQDWKTTWERERPEWWGFGKTCCL